MTAFNNPDKVLHEAGLVIGRQGIEEIKRLTDAIYQLGRKNAPKPKVSYNDLAIECGVFAGVLEDILDDDSNTFQKFENLRKLVTQAKKRQEAFMEQQRKEDVEELEQMAREAQAEADKED